MLLARQAAQRSGGRRHGDRTTPYAREADPISDVRDCPVSSAFTEASVDQLFHAGIALLGRCPRGSQSGPLAGGRRRRELHQEQRHSRECQKLPQSSLRTRNKQRCNRNPRSLTPTNPRSASQPETISRKAPPRAAPITCRFVCSMKSVRDCPIPKLLLEVRSGNYPIKQMTEFIDSNLPPVRRISGERSSVTPHRIIYGRLRYLSGLPTYAVR